MKSLRLLLVLSVRSVRSVLSVLSVLSLLVACSGGGGGGDQGGTPITEGTYRLNGLDTALQALAACSGSQNSETPNKAPTSTSGAEDAGVNEDGGANAEGPSINENSAAPNDGGAVGDLHEWQSAPNVPAPMMPRQSVARTFDDLITFSGDSFSVQKNGKVTMSGKWKQVDGNTLQVTTADGKFNVDYSVSSDKIMTISASKKQPDGSCSKSGSEGSDSKSPNPAPTDSGMNEIPTAIKGTWCFDSGFNDAAQYALASIILLDINKVYISTFQDIKGFIQADFENASRQDTVSFTLRYYHPDETSVIPNEITVSGDSMKIFYEPFKESIFKHVSNDAVRCP